MSQLYISEKTRTKLANKSPPVSRAEIEQCFATRERDFLLDIRLINNTIPPTQWFISDTFVGRILKVVLIIKDNGDIVIKTAYEPNEEEIRIYDKYAEVI